VARARYPLAVALRLTQLHRELNAQMDIKITEPVFFLGSDRKPGDVLRNVQVGPFRTQVIPGGLQRIPQFVEMAEQIVQAAQNAQPAPQTQPTAAVLPKPELAPQAEAAVVAPAKPIATALKSSSAPTPINRTTALLSGLASRRRKLEESIVDQANSYSEQLTAIEQAAPKVFAKATASLEDRQASLDELSDSLKDLAGANGGDPLGG
jgi:hypothetical protein